jgi:hypothetical protein
VKSALPTPTMIIDKGSLDALMMLIIDSSSSFIVPSVMTSKTKYF